MPGPFNDWYAKNPISDPSRSMVDTTNFKTWAKTEAAYSNQFSKSIRGDIHMLARQQFPKSFASGGILSGVFAPTRKEALANPWRRRLSKDSPKYLENLRKLDKLHPNNAKIGEAIAAAEQRAGRGVFAKIGSNLAGKALGVGVGTAFAVGSALLTEGNVVDKGRAVASSIAGDIGFAVGSFLGPAGSLAGALLFSVGADLAFAQADKLVDAEKDKRKLSWGAHTAPFQTAKAHTMRQQSLQLMNRGQMSSRSLLGQEAVFVHQ